MQDHPRMHAFSYVCSLPVTWQDGDHTIQSAIVENPMLHANFMTLCFIELELLPIEFLHCRNRDFRPFWLLWPWPDDLHIRTWHILDPWIYAVCAKMNLPCPLLWKSTFDRQTYRHTAHYAGGLSTCCRVLSIFTLCTSWVVCVTQLQLVRWWWWWWRWWWWRCWWWWCWWWWWWCVCVTVWQWCYWYNIIFCQVQYKSSVNVWLVTTSYDNISQTSTQCSTQCWHSTVHSVVHCVQSVQSSWGDRSVTAWRIC